MRGHLLLAPVVVRFVAGLVAVHVVRAALPAERRMRLDALAYGDGFEAVEALGNRREVGRERESHVLPLPFRDKRENATADQRRAEHLFVGDRTPELLGGKNEDVGVRLFAGARDSVHELRDVASGAMDSAGQIGLTDTRLLEELPERRLRLLRHAKQSMALLSECQALFSSAKLTAHGPQ